MYNKLLQRQLYKHFPAETLPENMAAFLNVVSASYAHYEQDRIMLERSIELSSEEMIELYQAQKKVHEDMKALFDNIEEVFFSVKFPELQLLQMSPACQKVYGFSVEDFRSDFQLWYNVVLDEDKKIIDGNIPIMYAGNSFFQEYRILHKDGSIRWLETKITPTLDKEKKLIRIDGVTSDISLRKHIEENIRVANENLKISIDRLAEAQEIAHLGSWVYDIKVKKGVRSAEFYKIFESSVNEFPSSIEGYTDFFHTDDRNLVLNKFNQVLKDHKPYQYQSRLLMKDGTIKFIQTNVQCTEDENGELIKLYGTIQDITQQKKIQEELEQYITELKKTNSELDKFVYSVSHDLRAPLSSMLGVIELSQENTQDETTLEYLRILKGSVKKLDGFISDILDYSRNSRKEIKKEEINFKELFADISANLKFMGSNNRKVDIQINVSNNVVVHSDRHRLSIILNNLISNAIRYQNSQIPNPLVDINIEISDTETSIIIRDNGIGISKENQKKIFDMFYRVSEKSEGSGLGLYIVKEVISKLNGDIEVQSEIGKGSAFIIKIPNN